MIEAVFGAILTIFAIAFTWNWPGNAKKRKRKAIYPHLVNILNAASTGDLEVVMDAYQKGMLLAQKLDFVRNYEISVKELKVMIWQNGKPRLARKKFNE